MRKFKVKAPPKDTFYVASPGRRFRGRHLFVVLLMLGVCFWIYREVYRRATNPIKPAPATKAAASPPAGVSVQRAAAAPGPEESDSFKIRHLTLHAGDTPGKIVKDSGIPGAYWDDWRKACKSDLFNRIKDGDEIIFVLSREDGLPAKVVYLKSAGAYYVLLKRSAGWECRSSGADAERRGRVARGAWSKNFYRSCAAGGLPASLMSNLADIFSYDIDFTSDLRKGDSFSVYFQELPIQSSKEKQFLILGAEMSVSGKVYQAYGFRLPDGSWDYFDSKGVSLKRAFLRSPIGHRMLLSPDAYGSIDPVLRIYRSHFRIRYVVPGGTRVCAIGDGVVSAVFRHGKRSFSVGIRHRGGYASWYRGLSALSRGLKRGSTVSRSEEIGSVGQAGGGKAYLDFRLYRYGKPVNFRTAEFAGSKSVPKAVYPEFEKSRDFCSAALRAGVPGGQKHGKVSGRD